MLRLRKGLQLFQCPKKLKDVLNILLCVPCSVFHSLPTMSDIESIVPSSSSSSSSTNTLANGKSRVLQHFLHDLIKKPANYYEDGTFLRQEIQRLQKKYKYIPSKGELLKEFMATGLHHPSLFQVLVVKAIRSESGILNISVSLPPNEFSCKYNCHFCPNEPGMPRSYLSNEDVFARAARVEFDTVRQVWDRLDALKTNGHPIDKLEFRVLGGTFSCYDKDLADVFVRDLYFAANTYFHRSDRPAESLESEQARNTHTKPHVVGLGVETRPDEITKAEIVRFRRYGVTRVEIGVQHTDDALLRRVNRGHGVKHSRQAIRLLKDYGFKVEIHIMADLPGATPEGDKACYKEVLQGPDLIPDYMKDYPCLDVSFTKVKEWKEAGTWQPYAERTPDAKDLKEVLIYRQQITPKWVRVNRIQRDFRPDQLPNGCSQLGYNSQSIKSNLAQIVKAEAEQKGIYCQCIRCCEVRDQKYLPSEVTYTIAPFTASGAQEYFLSAEVPRPNRPLMLGFLRLRISEALQDSILDELKGATAMIRELHVYGKVKEVGKKDVGNVGTTQHLGIGKELLQMAEDLSARHSCTKIAVISGIGVRDYYAKRGYFLTGTYMIKALPRNILPILLILAALVAFLAYWMY
jgi:ELP3 family radical SAM enzyme/protein acetyltransferase